MESVNQLVGAHGDIFEQSTILGNGRKRCIRLYFMDFGVKLVWNWYGHGIYQRHDCSFTVVMCDV